MSASPAAAPCSCESTGLTGCRESQHGMEQKQGFRRRTVLIKLVLDFSGLLILLPVNGVSESGGRNRAGVHNLGTCFVRFHRLEVTKYSLICVCISLLFAA